MEGSQPLNQVISGNNVIKLIKVTYIVNESFVNFQRDH